MNWPIPSKGRGGSTQQFAPKQNPKFLLRILQIFLKELFARKAASSGMVGIVTKRGKAYDKSIWLPEGKYKPNQWRSRNLHYQCPERKTLSG